MLTSTPTPAVSSEEFKEYIPTSSLNAEALHPTSLSSHSCYKGSECKALYLGSRISLVSDLSNVDPLDWSVQALQSLIQTYKLSSDSLDAILANQRSLTRYEFTNVLNQVVAQLETGFVAGNRVSQDDLRTLKRLQEDFAAELRPIADRLDRLKTQTEQIESQQFSTTTQLRGDASFLIADVFGENTEINTTASYRARLQFDTSFTGKDLLRLRLRTGNFERFEVDDAGNDLRLRSTASSDGNVDLNNLQYRFPIGDRATVFIIGAGGNMASFTNAINPLRGSTLSRFGSRNTIYRVPSVSAGLGARVSLRDRLSLDFGYLAEEVNNPRSKNGLFNGNYGVIAQLTSRTRRFDFGLTYIHAYSKEDIGTGTGSRLAELSSPERPIVSNSYGIQVNVRATRRFELGGWLGYTAARVINRGDAGILNYAITMSFPDLGKKGNQGGFIIGMQPRLTSASSRLSKELGARQDANVGLHLEAFYVYRINDFISITPGVIWLTAPNHDKGNPDIVIGAIRTDFRF
jgi:hypothetical protein